MTQFYMEILVDGQSHNVMLDKVPTALSLKLHRVEDPTDTVIATKVVLPA